MAGGFRIPLIADVSDWLRGTRKMADSMDDVVDSLDEFAREAQRAGDKAEDSLADGLKDAGKEAERLERKFKDAFDEVKRDAKKAGDKIGDEIKDGSNRAGEGLDDVKDEAKDSAREVAASFDGSMDSVVGGVQELAANLGGLGPGAAVAGMAMAAGIGYFFTKLQEDAEAAKQTVSDMYDDMLDSGNAFLSESYIMEGVKNIVLGLEGATADVNTIKDVVNATGIDQGTVLRAFAGDVESLNAVMGVLNGIEREQVDNIDANVWQTREWQNALQGVADDQSKAATAIGQARTAIEPTGDAVREYTEALAGVDDAAKSATDTINENNAAYTDSRDRVRENNGVLAEFADELSNVNEAAAGAGLSSAQLTEVQKENAEQFIATAGAAGIARDAAIDLAVEYGLIPEEVATALKTQGAAQAQTDARNTQSAYNGIDKTITTNIKVVPPTIAKVQAEVNAIARGLVPPTVTVNIQGRQRAV